MGSKEAQAIGDSSRKLPFSFRGLLVREESREQVAVPEALDIELAPADGLQEGRIFLGPGAQSANSLALPAGGTADRLDDFAQRVIHVDGGQCLQVSFVSRLGDLGSAMEIGDSFSKALPGGRTLGVPLDRAVDFKDSGVIQGGFDAQNASFFVIGLKRVALPFMFETEAFGPSAIMAGDFAPEVCLGFLTPEA